MSIIQTATFQENFWLRINKYVSPIIFVLVIILVTAGEVAVTMDTTTELSGTDEEDKREQSDYH